MIREHIEQAIRSLEAEKEQKIANVRASIVQEKIAPRNMEIDTKRDNALQELSAKLTNDIAELQAQYERARQGIIDTSEESKTANMNAILATETNGLVAEYDRVIAEQRKLLETIKE